MAENQYAEGSAMAEIFGETPALPPETPEASEASFESGSAMEQIFGAQAPAPEVQAPAPVPTPVSNYTPAKPVSAMDQIFYPDSAPEPQQKELARIIEQPDADTLVPTSNTEGAGFLPSLSGAALRTYAGAVNFAAAGLTNKLADLAESVAPGSDTAVWMRGEAANEQRMLEENWDEARNQPVSETLSTLAEAETFSKAGQIIMDSPEKWTLFKEIAGSTIPYSAGLLGGMALQGLKGVAGMSGLMNIGDNYIEAKELGMTDDEAWVDSAKKSSIQMGFDVLAMKIAGVPLSKNLYFDVIGQTGIQSFLGGSSEYAKGEAVNRPATAGSIVIEAGAEGLGAPVDMFTRRLTMKKDEARKETAAAFAELLEKAAPELAPEERAVLTAKKKLEFVQRLLKQSGEEVVGFSAQEGLPTDVSEPALQQVQSRVATAEEQEFFQNAIEVEDRDGNVTTLAEANMQPGDVRVARSARAPTADELKVEGAVRRTVSAWVQSFAPDMKVVVGTGAASEAAFGFDSDGSLQHPDNKAGGQIFNFGSESEIVIEVDMTHIMSKDGTINRGRLLEVMSHEFGHGLMEHTLQQATPEVRSALTVAHAKWLKKLTTPDAEGKYPSMAKFMKQRDGAYNARYDLEGKQDRGKSLKGFRKVQKRKQTKEAKEGLKKGIPATTYGFGMKEFLANQLAKSLTENSNFEVGTDPFFKKAFKVLKRFYRRFQEEYGAEGEFVEYLTYLAAKTDFDQQRKALSPEQRKNLDEGAFEKAQEQIGNVVAMIKKEYGAEAFPEDAEGDLDTYNFALKMGGGLTHLSKENRHIAGVQHYERLTKEWWNTKMAWTLKADETLKKWKKLGRKRGERFGRFMLDLTVMSYKEGKGYKAQDVEFQKLAEKWQLDGDSMTLYDLVKEDFVDVLNSLEEVLIEHSERAFEKDPRRLQEELASIAAEMNDLRKLNFFPLSRYGSFFVKRVAMKTFERDGVTYKPGDTASFEVFETKTGSVKAQKESDGGETRALRGKLTDMQQQFAGMPPQFIRMLKERLDLTTDQEHELAELLNDVAPGQSFKKHLAERKVVPGYNTDAMRGYASYFMHFSNHLGRIKFKYPFQDALGQVKQSADAVRLKAGDATKRDEILEHLQQHNDYILNPGNEMANLRAIGFLWYLGFVPKSAVVNLTQVPLVTYPYLAARYGDAEAIKSIAKATKTAMNYFRKPESVAPDMYAMLEELKKRAIIDESLATELAATSEGSVAQRLVPGTFLKSESAARAIREMAGAGAWMFQQAEKQNRRVTAIAAFELARKKGMSMKDAINAAEDAVETTQFEYARWNRPFFAQKKRSIFFLFWQYKTNALYFALRDPGNWRYALMMLGMAGIAGLPFSDDLMDIVEWLSKKEAKRSGDETDKINIRQGIREMAAEVGANPDLILHGGSRYLFGLPALADLVGVPLPNVDLGGSISMGRMIPGIKSMTDTEADVGRRLAEGGQELGGAVLSVPINLVRAFTDDNPDTLRRFEKAMPSVARNMSKAYRFVRDEGDTLPNGAKIAEFDLQDSHHRMEVFMQAAGFPPTRSQEAKEKHYMVRENVRYWEGRRSSLLELWDYTRRTKDREGSKVVKKAVQDYNKTVPFKGFAIRAGDVADSIKGRRLDRKLIEAGIDAKKRGMQVQRDVEKGFPVPDVDDEILR